MYESFFFDKHGIGSATSTEHTNEKEQDRQNYQQNYSSPGTALPQKGLDKSSNQFCNNLRSSYTHFRLSFEADFQLMAFLPYGLEGTFALILGILSMTVSSLEFILMTFMVQLFVEINEENNQTCEDEKQQYISEGVIGIFMFDCL